MSPCSEIPQNPNRDPRSSADFLSSNTQPAQTQSANPFAQTNISAPNPASANQTTLNASTATASNPSNASGPQIDIAHLRSTTKYDHLTLQLQQEILALDTAILNQIRQCTEVSDLLPSVVAVGSQLAPAIDFVSSKLEEVETGLENDADAVVSLRDGDLKKDEGEAKCVFRTVDRLKVPRQYQVGGDGGGQGMMAGFNGGLSGWWNQPQTLRGSTARTASSGGGLSVNVVDEDLDEDMGKGPKNLLELFNERTKEMSELGTQHRRLLGEIEDFVGGLEGKVLGKERELNERLDNSMNGVNGGSELLDERERQMQLLRYVFGEVQRNLYDVAEKIGITRDGVVEMTFKR